MSENIMTGTAVPQTEPDTGQGLSMPPALELDPEKYRAEIEDFDMSEEQKRELLETLWSIMRSFVELGFGTDICVQLFASFNEAADQTAEDVDLSSATALETPPHGMEEEV